MHSATQSGVSHPTSHWLANEPRNDNTVKMYYSHLIFYIELTAERRVCAGCKGNENERRGNKFIILN